MSILQNLSKYQNTNLAHLAIWNIGLFWSKSRTDFSLQGQRPSLLTGHFYLLPCGWSNGPPAVCNSQLHRWTLDSSFFWLGEFYPQIQATGRCKMDAGIPVGQLFRNFSIKVPPETATRRCFWFSQKSPDIYHVASNGRTNVFSIGLSKTYIFWKVFLWFSSPVFFCGTL